MAVNQSAYRQLRSVLDQQGVTLVAVSKTKPVDEILELYEAGQRDFGENYVQELVNKAGQLPRDIRWHFIGHLQTNKIKLIAPFVQLIQGVDSLKLLEEINRQGARAGRVLECLLQVHIASEETKFGMDESEMERAMAATEGNSLPAVRVTGLMGMASFTEDMGVVRKEFRHLKGLFDRHPGLRVLSMGMSTDYTVAIEEGSNMVRIGSLLFGERERK